MFEHYRQPVLPRLQFVRRVTWHGLIGLLAILFSLTVGTTGYHFIVGLDWLDAFLNAAMILSGMGPVDRLVTDSGKWFGAFYALYSGVVFVAVTGILLAPFAHRVLHRLHVEQGDEE